MHQEEEVMAGATILMVLRHTYLECGHPYNHETLFGMQAQMQQQHFMATTQVLNHLISVTERTLNSSGAYQSFGPGGNR
eukprot:3016616-Ditylum_brightwellii.AAC.1